jgi:NAD(P)-dependent dehydrogenase (short-subunit alcohol dehydrogenase family)
VKEYKDKVAFITGGGSGVGLGQARVFGRAGCKIVIADIRDDHLEDGLAAMREQGTEAHAIKLDITDRDAYARAADEVERVFGPVELLFNTAGVSIFGPLEKSTYDDYDWQMGVNFGGVVNGIVTFVPRMIEHGRGGYIVNTASLGALRASAPAGIYCASKFAVLGLSEALQQSLEPYDIGVSCLCPANVNSNIAEAVKTRPAHLSNSGYKYDDQVFQSLRTIYSAGKDPVELAEETMAAMQNRQFYIIPYPEARAMLREHFDEILACLPPEDADREGVAKRQAAMERFRRERAEQMKNE